MKVTIFHPKKTNSKIPMSPYDDLTFVFETYEFKKNVEIYNILVSHFILNIPLEKQPKQLRTYRRKVNLEPYYNDTINYLILDIYDVKSEFDKQRIIEYFSTYKIIIGESKSYNGIDNFNMKGILFTENIELKDIKTAISLLHHDLAKICSIDESISRKATYNVPTMKNNVFLNNEDGILFKFVKKSAIDYINDIKKEYIGELKEFDYSDLSNINADTMEKLCLKVFQSMGFVPLKNNTNSSITFRHPSEKKSPGDYFWFSSSPYTMHHANSVKSINIFDTVRKLSTGKELMKNEINYDKEFLSFNKNTKTLKVNEKLLSVTDDIHKKIDLFLNNKNGLLSIRSPMGTGKSIIIGHAINECHNLDMKVLIITNRVSVAKDFGKKYNIKVYNKDKYEKGDSLVVQFDSLWRYNIKFFDIVIMDEFISLMIHSRSNLNNSSINLVKFFGCFNKKLIIADAFLTGYENFILSNKETNVHLIDNEYRDETKLYDYDDYNYFIQSILIHAEKNKITISATSLSFINSLNLLLTSKGLKVVSLTAETPENTKKLIYNLFNKEEHNSWDVLIFSPTLTVGVSNLNNVKYHFHYDGSMASDAISSLQMIKRTRKSEEIHMFIKERINYLKTSYNDIRDEYTSNIGKFIDQNYLFDVDDYGEVKLSNTGRRAIKIDSFKNILQFNHKNAMMWLLKFHFDKKPIKVNKKFEANILLKYNNIIKKDKNKLISSNIEQFLDLNDIEKTSVLMDADYDRTLRALAEIDDSIKECSRETKAKILELAINDVDFIRKCKNYNILFNYTNSNIDDTDIQSLISESVINSDKDALSFYNSVLSFGQNKINDNYKIYEINHDNQLKYLLENCGYRHMKKDEYNIIGQRSFIIDNNIKKYFKYIKLENKWKK